MVYEVIRRAWRTLFPRTELDYTENSLARHRNELFELEDSFDPTKDCCLDCATGGYNTRLANKIQRIEDRIVWFKNRQIKRGSKCI